MGAGSDDVYLIRTNADGDTLWTKTFGGTSEDYGFSVQECAGGGFIIAGLISSFGADSGDIYLIKTDADGDSVWAKTYGGTDDDYGRSVQECTNGGFIIAGYTKSFGPVYSDDVYLIRTNANGDTLWTKTYGGITNPDPDYGYSVQECASGGFIIAGETASFGAGRSDVWLIRTDSLGDAIYDFRLISPDGGEYWLGKSVHPVEWYIAEAGVVAKFRLLYSIDGGASYSDTIATNVPSDADAWDWQLPNIDCSTCRVKVEALGNGDKVLDYVQSPDDFTIIKTAVEESNKQLSMSNYQLSIYPNPSLDNVVIKYGLPEKASISLGLYDISGRLVKTLYSGIQEKGYHKVNVGAYHDTPTGIYFIRLDTHTGLATGDYKATRKLTILK